MVLGFSDVVATNKTVLLNYKRKSSSVKVWKLEQIFQINGQ